LLKTQLTAVLFWQTRRRWPSIGGERCFSSCCQQSVCRPKWTH